MSLLLDALNRASKDKATAAAAQAASSSDSAAAPPPSAPATPGDAASGLPVLELSLASAERTSATADPWQSEQAVAAPDQPLMASFVLTEPIQATKPAGPSPEAVTPAPTPTPAPAPAPTPAAKPAASGTPRVAQDIVRAKAPATRAKPPMRLLVLGGLAALLAAGLGSVLMGWWGDPSNWIQSSGLAGSSTVAPGVASRGEPVAASPAQALTPSPSATEVPATSDAPVLHEASNRPLVRKATVSPPAGPITREPRDTVVSTAPAPAPAPAAAKPVTSPKTAAALVQSRTAGPSPLELAYAALVQGRLPAAAQAYEQALLANPEERDALLGLAYIAHQQGQPDEARGYYQRVLRHDPGNASARSGLLAINAIDDPQALASRAREVAEQNPDSAAAQSTLGHIMAREGRLADAQQAFFRAHSLEPAVALHAFNLAVALDRLRQYGPARQYYERALALLAQSGAERAGGVPQAVVQTRLEQLRAAHVDNPLGAARE